MDKQREVLLSRVKEVTRTPGVYLLKDREAQILYIGKAKNLRNRLSSYFQAKRPTSTRLEMLVELVQDFEVILTETESEALILENQLIKKHLPKFNVRLKDDKTYPYIRVNFEEEAPRLEWTRKLRKDGSRYFGPFPSAWSAKQVLHLLNETFKLRDCSDNTYRHRSRPCLLYQMERCSAPCVKKIEEGEYHESVRQAVQVLEGRSESVLESLRGQMKDYSEQEEFETAAFFRDQIKNLELVTETQGVFVPGADWNRDVIGIARSKQSEASRFDSKQVASGLRIAHGVMMQVRNGTLVGIQHYLLQNAEAALSDEEILETFLAQHYLRAQPEDKGEVLIPFAPSSDSIDFLESALGVSLRVPETKEEKQLVQVAFSNADHALFRAGSAKGHVEEGLAGVEEVQEKLFLPKLPTRIECYDVSNIQGEEAVASRVVFIEGAAKKDLYRRYKIRTVEGSNDFAMMKEVLERRFLNAADPFPELVVVDGGKGQLAQAAQILEELNIQGVAIAGLAKARTLRDFKAKEVEATEERVFIPNRKNPIKLLPNSAAFRLLVQVRDEAHRFAISYHRLRRKKKNLGKKA